MEIHVLNDYMCNCDVLYRILICQTWKTCEIIGVFGCFVGCVWCVYILLFVSMLCVYLSAVIGCVIWLFLSRAGRVLCSCCAAKRRVCAGFGSPRNSRLRRSSSWLRHSYNTSKITHLKMCYFWCIYHKVPSVLCDIH